MRENNILNIAVVGHVDDGKSTLLGRLLYDTNHFSDDKIKLIKNFCRKNSRIFEYAFLIDALKKEQAQGITIDSARVFFRNESKRYLFFDSPGHINFLKNMVTGASRADAAFIVIDASEGIRENSRRHGFLLSMLGIKKVIIVVNKMDLVEYDKNVFDSVSKEYSNFLRSIEIDVTTSIPVSALNGENVVAASENMQWYRGKTVLKSIELFQEQTVNTKKPFRMPVQGVYKFTAFGDNKKIIAGSILSGKVQVGDEIVFYPSLKKSRIKEIVEFDKKGISELTEGKAAGFTLEEQICIFRGELAVSEKDSKPCVASRIRASIFWLGKQPMVMGKKYIFKLGTSRVSVQVESIEKVCDAASFTEGIETKEIENKMIAECVLKTEKPIAFDLINEIKETGRFVIVDDYEISGGGIILKDMKD